MKTNIKYFFVPVMFLFLPLQFSIAAQVLFHDSTLTSESNLQSADKSSKKLFWFTVGGGIIGPGLGGDFKATYAWGSQSISAKVCGGEEFSIFTPPNNEVVEYGLYYGTQTYNTWGLLRIAAGPSYFTGYQNRTDYIHNFGIGVEIEAMAKYEFAGISIMATAMMSPKFLYGGIVLNLNIGKLN